MEQESRELSAPTWPESGIAIAGDFKGIQSFVLKPVPGASGAAKRLRGRSLRVTVITQCVARRLESVFADMDAHLFFLAGGRFLLHSRLGDDWKSRVADQQAELDAWLLKSFGGEVSFHLAAAPISGGRIPFRQLEDSLRYQRQQPLRHPLQSSNTWNDGEFFTPAQGDIFRCPACLRTAPRLSPNEKTCEDCVLDASLGTVLAHLHTPHLVRQTGGSLLIMGERFEVVESENHDGVPIATMHWMPKDESGNPMDFDEIARRSSGDRKWLGYLQIDADNIGQHFRNIEGHPERTWVLSHFLQSFFCDGIQGMLSNRFPMVYPVYGGGDDVFLIGPWDQTLDPAVEIAEYFKRESNGQHTLSAGVALAKPSEHILTKAEQGRDALRKSKDAGRNRISAFGITAEWPRFADLLKTAKRVAEWHKLGLITSSFLQDLLDLHQKWKRSHDSAFRPLLHYQIARNLKGHDRENVRDWAVHLMQQASEWPWIDFVCRYCLLVSRAEAPRRLENV